MVICILFDQDRRFIQHLSDLRSASPQNLAQGNGLVPWIEYYLNRHHKFHFHAYLQKNIDLVRNENSSQTLVPYAIFSSSSDPSFLSQLLSRLLGAIFKSKLQLDTEAFQYRFLTNNYWNEFSEARLFTTQVSLKFWDHFIGTSKINLI